jgi:hypothetical protein
MLSRFVRHNAVVPSTLTGSTLRVMAPVWWGGQQTHVCLCIVLRCGSGVVTWAPAWYGVVRGSRTRSACVGGLRGFDDGRGAIVAGVLARQIPGLEQKPDLRQLPQRGVGTVVAEVSVFVLLVCMRPAFQSCASLVLQRAHVSWAASLAWPAWVGVTAPVWWGGQQTHVCLCMALRCGSGVVAWAPAWCGAVLGSRTRLACVGGLRGFCDGRGAIVAGVLARQIPGLAQQPDLRQLPQRGVGTVVAEVSVCVLLVCMRPAFQSCASLVLQCAHVSRAASLAWPAWVGVTAPVCMGGQQAHVRCA